MHVLLLFLGLNTVAAGTLDWSTAVQLAEEGALDASMAAYDLERQEINQAAAALNWTPSVSWNAGAQGSLGRTFSEQLGTNITEPVASLSTGLSASMPLYQGGALVAERAGAEASVSAAGFEQEQTQLDLRWTVADWLLQIEQGAALVRVQEAAVEAERELLLQVENQVEAGSRTRADLFAQRSVLAARESSLSAAEQAVREASLSLLVLLRVDSEQDWTFSGPPALPAARNAADLVAVAVEQRPDLKAAEDRIEAAVADERAAKAGYRPSVSLGAGSSTSWLSSNPDPFGEQLDTQNRTWAAVDVRVPLLDAGVRRAQVDTASVAVQEANLERQRLLDALTLSVEVLLSQQQQAQASLDASRSAAAFAAQAVEVLNLRYQSGAETLATLSQARATLVDAELQAAWDELALQRVRYQLAWVTGTLLV